MREIIFRGKRIDDGKWFEGNLTWYIINFTDGKTQKNYSITHIEYGMSSDTYDCEYMRGYNEVVIPESIGQFTGYTDKNRKRVFEGDICRVVYLDKRRSQTGEHYCLENEIIAEVVFEKGTFCFRVVIEDIAMYCPIGFPMYKKQEIKYFEVLGNIYETPELLD